MAHDHAHDHGQTPSEYYLEQLLAVGVCGLFGVVAVLMYRFDMLQHILVPAFHTYVLCGGVLLLVFTAIRGVALWKEVGALADAHAGHNHAPGEECHHGHDHAPGEPCGHDHDHGQGWMYARLVVLAFPLLLFFFGLPNAGFSKDWVDRRLGKDEGLTGDLAKVVAKGGAPVVDFNEISLGANDPGRRALYEGMSAKLKGQFRPIARREFTLYRLKMNCCAADMIPLKARIVTAFEPTGYKDGDWVEVTGVIQFVDPKGDGRYIAVLRVDDAAAIQPTVAS